MVQMPIVTYPRDINSGAFRGPMKKQKTNSSSVRGVAHQIKFDPIEPYPPLDNVDNAYIQKMTELDELCERYTNGKCHQVPSFLKRLWLILATEDPSIIGWSPDGRGIQIRNRARMESIVLPKYYNHSKMRSFQRQLNYFGFKKTNKSKKDTLTFGNANFNMKAPSDMAKIQRKLRDRKRGGKKIDRSPVMLTRKEPESIDPIKKEKVNSIKVIDSSNKENEEPEALDNILEDAPSAGQLLPQNSLTGANGIGSVDWNPSLTDSTMMNAPPPTLQLEPLKSEDQRWLNSLADDQNPLMEVPEFDLEKLL
jgi:hypothetical protein